jgi:hypothetical protein
VTTQNPSPVPPEQAAVVERALCLTALVVRGFLETAILLAQTPEDRSACEDYSTRLSRWLNEQDFTAHFTLRELEALSAAPGVWTSEQHDQHCDHVEALGVLLWALSLQENFPNYHESFRLPDLEPIIGWKASALLAPASTVLDAFPKNGAAALADKLELRPQPAILARRAASECWQWRAHVAALQRANTPAPAGHDYSMMIGIAAEEAFAAGAIPRPIGNDFPLGRKPFAKATEAEQLKCARIAAARHLALDWLCGFATPWDEVVVASAVGA